jgi:hypothetical protein
MTLYQRRAIAFSKETAEGTAISLGSLTAYEVAFEPTINLNTPKKRRRQAQGKLSEKQPIRGMNSAEMTFAVEFAGHNTATTAPIWDDLLEACGMRLAEGTVYVIPVNGSGITGTVTDGLELTYDTSQTADAFGAYLDGATYVVVENATAAPTSGATFSNGGVSFTASGASIRSYFAAKPTSERVYQIPFSSGTGTWAVDDVITGGTSGARGLLYEAASGSTGTLKFVPIDGTGAFQSGETITSDGAGSGSGTASSGQSNLYIPSLSMCLWDNRRAKLMKGARGTFSLVIPTGEDARFNFTFTGCRESVSDELLPSVTKQVTAVPPVFVGGTTYLGDLQNPGMREISVDLGAAVALRPSPSESSGYISSRIGARGVGVTFNPEAAAEAEFDVYEKARDAESFQAGASWGTATGNRCLVHFPRLSVDQANEEDQDGFTHDAISTIAFSFSSDEAEHEVVLALF